MEWRTGRANGSHRDENIPGGYRSPAMTAAHPHPAMLPNSYGEGQVGVHGVFTVFQAQNDSPTLNTGAAGNQMPKLET